MQDARGVFFNARPEPLREGSAASVTITSATRSSEQAFEDFNALLRLFDEADIKVTPRDEILKNGELRNTDPVMLHNPKSKAWPVRDQGTSRGTCVAFAALAVLELSEMAEREQQETGTLEEIDHSEEFVYAKSRTDFADLGDPDDKSGATFLVQAARTLISFGVPPEASLPYRYIKNDPDWTASIRAEISTKAEENKLSEDAVCVSMKFSSTSQDAAGLLEPFPDKEKVEVIKTFLRAGSAVAITLPVYPTSNHSPWTVGNAWKTGVIPDLTQAVKDAGDGTVGHAVCIIGMVPDPQSEGKGWFIFRNSWGTRFGYTRPRNPALDAVLAPGYGAISYAHVGQECWGMMALVSSG